LTTTAVRPLDGRTAVITGAGGGLGRAIAHRFAELGANVACGDRNAEATMETVAEITELGGHASGFAVDVTSADEIREWHGHVTENFGEVTIVVNAAGMIERRMLRELPGEGLQDSMNVNVLGPFLVVQEYEKELVRHPHGRVVNIASVAGLSGYPFPAYAASKAALVNLSRSLLSSFWGTGVTVNAVCPGAMDTAMFNSRLIPALAKRTPRGRIVTVQEVAETVTFLSTPAAAALNGLALPVDGGESAVFHYEQQG
jgi:NAD(P)-dependent dehydrogenase (short-subunit alcohol dehydrogenase family)